jgi:hypothetical protein
VSFIRRYRTRRFVVALSSFKSCHDQRWMPPFSSRITINGRVGNNGGAKPIAVAPRSREGFLTELTAGVQPWPRERVLMPLSRHFAETPSGTIGCRSPLQRSTANRRSGLGGSVFLRRVGSDQGPKNFEKALDGAARAEGLRGDAGAFAQEVQLVSQQFGIAQPGLLVLAFFAPHDQPHTGRRGSLKPRRTTDFVRLFTL